MTVKNTCKHISLTAILLVWLCPACIQVNWSTIGTHSKTDVKVCLIIPQILQLRLMSFLLGQWDLIPVLLNADPSALVQRRVGVGKPVASHRRITLLPSDAVILVAEIITDGLRHWSSSARWNRTPAKFSGPLHVRNWSINATGMLLILDNSMSLEIRQSQNQGLSCRPANIDISV